MSETVALCSSGEHKAGVWALADFPPVNENKMEEFLRCAKVPVQSLVLLLFFFLYLMKYTIDIFVFNSGSQTIENRELTKKG